MVSKRVENDEELSRITNLIELLEYRAEHDADKISYVYLEDGETQENVLTYGKFDLHARTIAAALQSMAESGDRAILLYPPGLEFINAFFGCLYASIIAVPVYPPDPSNLAQGLERLRTIIKNSGASVILTNSFILNAAGAIFSQDAYLKEIRFVATDTMPGEQADTWKRPIVDGGSLAFLQYTSGSTGTPRGVMVSHGNLLHNQLMIQTIMEHSDKIIGVGWLPLYHDMGLIGNVIQPLYLGIKCVLMSPIAFLQKPARWLKAISRYKATTSGAPNFAYDLCVKRIAPEDLAGIDLSTWNIACNGAEPIRKGTVDRFIKAFAPYGFRPEAFCPSYGLAEATLIVAGPMKRVPVTIFHAKKSEIAKNRVVEADEDDTDVSPYVGCGRTCMGEKIVIVDPDTREQCRPDQIGEIWVSGRSVAQGYWNNPEQTEKTFHAYLNTGEGPFLRTEDIGFIRDGDLFITGRIKDMIIIHGQNHYPQDIEQIVEQSHPALRPGCSAAFSVYGDDEEHLVVVAEVKSAGLDTLDINHLTNLIRESLLEKLGLETYAVALIKERSIPKTSSGKIQRSACKAALLEWSLPIIKMNVLDLLPEKPRKNIILNKLINLTKPVEHLPILEHYLQEQIAHIIDIPVGQIDVSQPIGLLDIDSLTLIQLKTEFDDTLGIELEIKKLIEEELTIVDLALLISEMLQSYDAPSAEEAKKENGHKLTAKASQRIFLSSLVEYSRQSRSLSMQMYNSIEDLPKDKWDAIAPRSSVSLESRHLSAIEKSGINDIKPYYVIISEDDRPVGIAYFSIFDIDLLKISDTPPEIQSTLRIWYPDILQMKMLECGLISGLGESIFCADDAILHSSLRSITQEMEEKGKEAGVDFILIRDIPYDRYHIYNVLENNGFTYVLGFPTTKMEIKWSTFDGYLDSLKSIKRHNFNNTISALNSEDITIEVLQDFGHYADRLESLWKQVNQRATEYEHERLTASYFREINRCLPDRSHIIAIKRSGEIIAYALCLEGDEEYFGVYCGIDYQFLKEYNLYVNIHILIIKEAITRKKRWVNLGITTYEPKLRIGCELEPLGYFIKNIKDPGFTPTLADLLRGSFKQPENIHRPFKDQDISGRIQLKEIGAEIKLIKRKNNVNLFNKARSYVRSDIPKYMGLYSFFPPFESVQDPVVRYNGKEVIMLGTNSYLGYNSNRDVIASAKEALDKYGTGCSGSPLLNGTLDIHVELSRSLAEFMKKDDALLFSTGYQTNLGVISAILDADSVAIIDGLSHASLIDGVVLSGAKIVPYRHNDPAALEEVLVKYKDRQKLVITDSVFSMEGSIVKLPEIVALAKKYNAQLMLDEAHAIGVIGPGGRGVAEYYNLLDGVDLIMGTFSKSFASIGGFIAGEKKIIDYLRHVSRSHMFSASLPASAVATVLKVLENIKADPGRGKKALENARYMSVHLQKLGFNAPFRNTAIVPVHCGDELLTLALYKKLFGKGVFVNPVLFPAVPKGEECLRTSYMVTHTEEILQRALTVFKEIRTPDFPRG